MPTRIVLPGGLVQVPAARISTPSVGYATSSGNDDSGDGSLAKPYATAQKLYDQGFTIWQLGADEYDVLLIGDIDITVFGQGSSNTSLSFTYTPSNGGGGASGSAGSVPSGTGGTGDPGQAGSTGPAIVVHSDHSVKVTADLHGGDGGNGGGGGPGGPGDNGSTMGGTGGTGGKGGAGGTGGDIYLYNCAYGNLNTSSGTPGTGGAGGTGGQAGDDNTPANGGDGGLGGDGGDSSNGLIRLEGCAFIDGTITAQTVSSTGGTGGTPGSGLNGGSSGTPGDSGFGGSATNPDVSLILSTYSSEGLLTTPTPKLRGVYDTVTDAFVANSP